MTFIARADGLPFAEQRRAAAHAGGAKADGGLEVGAHAHRELMKAVAGPELGGQREVPPWRLVRRRDAHQPLERQPELRAAARDERVGLAGGDARLLRLLASVDLDVEARTAPGALHLA